MSFHFNWPKFSEQFHADATQMVNAALNKGNKPRIIADKIEVVELSMGTLPPELEIRDIGELTREQFRGIFRLSYAGDAHIVLKTKVQANPLNHKKQEMDVIGQSRGILAAHQPLVVPMLLRLSHFKLNAYVVLVVSKQKGITLVFKTDPLQSLDVNSTFDSIAVIQKYIQREIEGQLREMFREDLPAIIHRLSQKWTAGKTKVEAPYLHNNPTTLPRDMVYSSASIVSSAPLLSPNLHPSAPPPQRSLGMVGLRPSFIPRPLSVAGFTSMRPRPTGVSSFPGSTASLTSRSKPKPKAAPPPLERTSSFPDIENYDSTYGLRPEGLPSKSGYSGFGQLFAATKGLGDFVNETDEGDEDDRSEDRTFDMIDWEDMIPDYSTYPPSVAAQSVTEYETLPAVGGGTISRPRVVHSQSQIGLPSGPASRPGSVSSRPTQRPPTVRSSTGISPELSRNSEAWVAAWREQQLRQAEGTSYFPEIGEPGPSRPPTRPAVISQQPPTLQYSYADPLPSEHRKRFSVASDPRRSSSSSYTQRSLNSDHPHTVSTPPSSDVADEHGSPSMSPKKAQQRRRSLSPSIMHRFDSLHVGTSPKLVPTSPAKIVLRPHVNTTVSHLSALSQSNHTLSPYTHAPEHFTVRSVPPRPPKTPEDFIPEKQKPVKARRKRMINLAKKSPAQGLATRVSSPSAPSEFSDEVDHYFRPDDHDDQASLLRRRQPFPAIP